MAINPATKYPGQVNTSDPAWPWGRPQNESTPGARNGTPLDSEWVADFWGFQQALLETNGTAPNGTPDRGGMGGTQSQMLRAIRALNFNMVMPLHAASHAGSHFTFEVNTGWTQTTVGSVFGGAFLYFPLGPFPVSLPERLVKLTEVTLRVKPNIAHAALPSVKPGFWVFQASESGLTELSGSSFVDQSSNIAQYNAAHDITASFSPGLTLGWEQNPTFYIGAYGEYGTNAVTGLRLLGLRCRFNDGAA